MTSLRRTLILCAMLCALATSAFAHDVTFAAVASFGPAPLRAGTRATVQVHLVDVYRAAVSKARVQATLWANGSAAPAPVRLRESAPGVYGGTLRVPGNGTAVLRVDAVLADGLWVGQVPLSVGPDELPAIDLGVHLLHREMSTPASQSPAHTWLLAGAGVVLLVLTVGGWIYVFRKPRAR